MTQVDVALGGRQHDWDRFQAYRSFGATRAGQFNRSSIVRARWPGAERLAQQA
jgi:hypothetical protein